MNRSTQLSQNILSITLLISTFLFSGCGDNGERLDRCSAPEALVADAYFMSSGILLSDFDEYLEDLDPEEQYKEVKELSEVCEQVLLESQPAKICYTEPNKVRILHNFASMKKKCAELNKKFTPEVLEKYKNLAEKPESTEPANPFDRTD